VVSDDELTVLALGASDHDVDRDAVPIRSLEPSCDLLPDWYMPAASGHAQPGWRRRLALLVVGAILLINAAGLCVTYGPVTFG
jgi:hypothetical protein